MTNKRITISSAEELMTKAQAIAGIDIVDREAIEPLSYVVKSYNEEVSLTQESAWFVEKHQVLSVLCNRLRMQRDFVAHPEILEQKIQPPLFIAGMPRSGTTKVHKLLAASGSFNYLTFWRSLHPALHTGSRDESPERRIRETDEFVEYINRASPKLRFTHELATLEPEEENWLNNHSFTMPFLGFLEMVAYPTWLASRGDFTEFQIKFLRDALKYLQWQGYGSADKPWVLKTILYCGHEATIQKVFPGVKFVMPHRALNESVASLCSLLQAYSIPISGEREVDNAPFVTGIAALVNAQLKLRQARKDLQWLDFRYTDLIAAPEAVMEKVFVFRGVPLSDEARSKMRTWNSNNRYIKGGHKYTLAEAGVTEEQVNHAFAQYIEFVAASNLH